jgi:hypothetical protein
MRIIHAALALTLLVGGAAFAEDKGGKKGAPPKGPVKEETIDDILASKPDPPPPDDKPPEDAKPPEVKPADTKAAAKPADKVAAATKAPAKPEEPPPPPTDDNDTTAEAARPVALEAVKPTSVPRKPGAYELGALDCRMLDGAGIERVLPKKITAGEEPDLLCRVLVTQPPTVATAVHELTLTVAVGSKITYQQIRTVRVSAIGRRSMVFIVPADRISSEDAAKVTMKVVLSAPAKPPAHEIKFVVEPAD